MCRCLHSALLFLLLPVFGIAHAQHMQQAGDHVIHYNALPSEQLSPEVARQYGITRSGSRALLNVAVLHAVDGTQQPSAAEVLASATNSSGQRQTLRMREVREGSAIYYLAEPRISGDDTLTFELSVLPAGAASPTEVRYVQQFFARPR